MSTIEQILTCKNS